MSLYDAFEVAAAAVIPNQEMLVLKLHISILLGNRMLQISSLRRRSKRKQAGDCGALGSLRIRFYSSLSAFQRSSWCITYLVNGIYGTVLLRSTYLHIRVHSYGLHGTKQISHDCDNGGFEMRCSLHWDSGFDMRRQYLFAAEWL